MNALELMLSSLVGPRNPYGKRFICGQARCVWRERKDGPLVDHSNRLQFDAAKYQPHQGEREKARRLKQLSKSK